VHFKTGAALVGTRDQQEVEVLVAGVKTDRWIFTMTANQGERSVTVPAALVTNGPNGPVVELEFRPSSVVPVNELDVRNKDDRALGLAIMGMRVSLG
jgi:hypothetical protein